jgi:hypothetical protein
VAGEYLAPFDVVALHAHEESHGIAIPIHLVFAQFGGARKAQPFESGLDPPSLKFVEYSSLLLDGETTQLESTSTVPVCFWKGKLKMGCACDDIEQRTRC